MKGLIKALDYEKLKVEIVTKSINKSIEYTFESFEEMKCNEDKLAVDFNCKVLNGEIEIDKIRFSEIKIDDIVVNEIIGSGDNGVVYKGLDEFFERNVAIKVWIPNFKNGKNKSNKTRFKEEVKKMANINENSVTKIYTRGKIFDFDYVVMELVNGVTLNTWLKKYEPSFYQRYIVIRELFESIEKLHKEDIHHGDLHSSNIMIETTFGRINTNEDSSNVHIIDFGTSVFSGEESSRIRESRLMINTFYNIIPEIKNNKLINVDEYVPSNMLTTIFRSATHIICIINGGHIGENAIVDIAMLSALIPVYNIDILLKIIIEYSNNDSLDVNIKLFEEEFMKNLFHILRNFEDTRENQIGRQIGELYDIYRQKFVNDRGNNLLNILCEVDNFKEILYMNFYS